MKCFTIEWVDLDWQRQQEILMELQEQVKQELEMECTQYKSTRSDNRTKTGTFYRDATWKEIAKSEYNFEDPPEFEEFYIAEAEKRARAWRGVEMQV